MLRHVKQMKKTCHRSGRAQRYSLLPDSSNQNICCLTPQIKFLIQVLICNNQP